MIRRCLGLLRSSLRHKRGLTTLPRMLTYTVTFGCNARCIMCDSWKMPPRDELTVEDLDRIFAQLPRLDAVRLTGGEPFVRRDLGEIAALVMRHLRPLVLHVTTNGFLTERIVRFCEQRPRRTRLHLLVSVDGVGEKHNQVRGSRLAWQSVMETLRALAPHQRRWKLRLTVNQTIVDAEGVEHYRRLRDLLRPMGIANQAVLAYDTSATYNLQSDLDVSPQQVGQFTTFGEFRAEDLQELVDEATADLRHLPWFERLAKRYYLRGIRHRMLEHLGVPNPSCVALNSHLRMFPNGDIPTCQFNSRIVGNLRERTFADVWNSVLTDQQRAWVRRCPGCWAECEVLPNAVYSLDFLRPTRAKARA
jgi:MoaA/NifB/PqqE/SkfB family radical SAM enzyme